MWHRQSWKESKGERKCMRKGGRKDDGWKLGYERKERKKKRRMGKEGVKEERREKGKKNKRKINHHTY